MYAKGNVKNVKWHWSAIVDKMMSNVYRSYTEKLNYNLIIKWL